LTDRRNPAAIACWQVTDMSPACHPPGLVNRKTLYIVGTGHEQQEVRRLCSRPRPGRGPGETMIVLELVEAWFNSRMSGNGKQSVQ
jgi:hypothetical protein